MLHPCSLRGTTRWVAGSYFLNTFYHIKDLISFILNKCKIDYCMSVNHSYYLVCCLDLGHLLTNIRAISPSVNRFVCMECAFSVYSIAFSINYRFLIRNMGFWVKKCKQYENYSSESFLFSFLIKFSYLEKTLYYTFCFSLS